jgi:hypothetical protein
LSLYSKALNARNLCTEVCIRIPLQEEQKRRTKDDDNYNDEEEGDDDDYDDKDYRGNWDHLKTV